MTGRATDQINSILEDLWLKKLNKQNQSSYLKPDSRQKCSKSQTNEHLNLYSCFSASNKFKN